MRIQRKAIQSLVGRLAALTCAVGMLIPVVTQQQASAVSHHRKHARKHQEHNIMAVARGNAELSTFTTAVAAAGLSKTLEGSGPYTVFAPTNKAFSKLPKAQLDSLLKDTKQLKQILLYHVVKGKVTAADIDHDKHALMTVEGERLHTNVKDGRVEVGGALVSQADIKASNGLIHVVDDVLTPPGARF
jgi:uncharacterized surface protein with fasciclin (FAS1) repeats